MLPLSEIYVNSIQDEVDAIDRILSPQTHQIQSKSDKEMLWFYNSLQALGNFFIDEDLNASKQHFYRCSRIDEYLIRNYDSRLLDSGMANISYALLSDNLSLINRYAYLTHPWYTHTIKSGSLVHAVQNIIKEDWVSLENDIATYERITATQKGKINIADLMYFNGILKKDKSIVAEALFLLLKDHKKRNKHMGIAQDYISIPALGYAKLSWLKGIEVDIDHPLIPKELLPYQPLEKYEDKYDFLKEF
ncbi:MAG: hypothetical protein EOO91_08325 [Pedobacter sp.]|nr:MAG: hypothetical protein EOO91_08325 [Pedobacter sp.]